MDSKIFFAIGIILAIILQGCYVIPPGSYPYRVVGGGEQGNPSISQNSVRDEEDLVCRSEYDRVMTEIDEKHRRFLRELDSYLRDGGSQEKADQSRTAEAGKYSAAKESAMGTRGKCINGIMDGKTENYRYRPQQRQDRNSNYGQQYVPHYHHYYPGYLPFFPIYDYTWRWRGNNYWYCLDWPQYCGGRWGGRHRWRWRRNHRW